MKIGKVLVENLSNKIGTPNILKEAGITACVEHMKAGNFLKMNAAKKVSFIERIDKTKLGIEGLQIITYADKTRLEKDLDVKNPEYEFINISKELLKNISGKYIIEKYKIKLQKEQDNKEKIYDENKLEQEKIKEYLNKERIQWILKNTKI